MWRKRILRWTAYLMGVVLVLAAAVWIAFVPGSKEPGYVAVGAWGERGASPGQFNDPTGIAIAGNEVFVSDARNGRIQVFDFDGAFRRQFGGDGKGKLGRPMNLTVAGGELYVADYWHDNVKVFGLDGAFRRAIGKTGSGPGEFKSPGGVAVAANGDLVVVDFYNQRVQHLKSDGTFVRQWGTTGAYRTDAGGFGYPTDAAFDAGGRLYVADGYNDRVQAFAADGGFAGKWGGPFAMNIFGPFRGWFATVTSIAVDRAGNVFVADFYNDRIQKFAADGAFLTSFGSAGTALGRFDHAIALDVAPDGTVFTADFGNNRIQKWRPKGG